MFQKLLRFFHNPQRNNQRILRHMNGLVRAINALEAQYMTLSDQELSEKTAEFKQRLADGESLDTVLIPAFATVREASRRVLGMRPFDVQLYGGMALHQGMIAEMKTGEGKTLVGTLPVYLNALTGKGVHVVTVNDYLAQRDSSVMRPLYEFLGLSVGCIVQDLSHSQRRHAYHCDITYGTNNEFGFDYLKDNMKFAPGEMCQRGFAYAIVDEVDSILIDEARTPLIISGPADDASQLYDHINEIIMRLGVQHYEVDEKNKNVAFTDAGYIEVERMTKEAGLVTGTDLFQSENLMVVHHLNQSLKAHKNFQKDVDYIVKDGKVVLIDEFTGRMMKGRRYSDGLHQAIEAKERVEIEVENQTLASITFQNFFRMYGKLSGMTGTAETEAVEFQDIYKLPVLSIPTNVPVARQDLDDEIFRTFDQKLQVILRQIKECHDRKQPVLVGTLSIEKSEVFADALKKLGIPFHVLNARHHEQEAKIIAQAGAPGAITIATNMAGRGTDIKLGGNLEVMLSDALRGIEDEAHRADIEKAVRQQHAEQEAEVRAAGGLFVLGTERNENRRIDNQLRGRSGRQGDPGASKFFISLQDDLMRIFGPNLKMLDYSLSKTDQSSQSDNEAIAHPWLTRSIEKAQQRVEAQHFDTRKHLLKYADVLNAQRTAVYDERHALMHAEDVHDRVMHIVDGVIQDVVQAALDQKKSTDQWNWGFLTQEISTIFGLNLDFDDQDKASVQNAVSKIQGAVHEKMANFDEQWGREMRMRMEKSLILKILDQTWIAHLNAMDHLRSGIHLQAYGQKDPLNEYRHEAFVMFKSMKNQWYRNFLTMYFQANPDHVHAYEDEDEDMEALLKKWSYQHDSVSQDDESEDSDQPMDYRKILDNLLSQDDGDFEPKDWEDMWSDDQKPKGKKDRGSKDSGQKSVVKKGHAVKAGDKKAGARSVKSDTQVRSGAGARSGAIGGKSVGKLAGNDQRSGARSGARPSTPASFYVGKSAGKTRTGMTMGMPSDSGKSESRRGVAQDFRDEDWGMINQEQAMTKKVKPIKRRAPSKRGPYIPKTINESHLVAGEYRGRQTSKPGYIDQGVSEKQERDGGHDQGQNRRFFGSAGGGSGFKGRTPLRQGNTTLGKERRNLRGEERRNLRGRSGDAYGGASTEQPRSDVSRTGPNRHQAGASRGRSGRGDSLAEQFYSTRMTAQREKSAGSSRSFKQGQAGKFLGHTEQRTSKVLGVGTSKVLGVRTKESSGQRTKESSGQRTKESSGQRTKESSGRKALVHSQGYKPVTGRGHFGKKPGSNSGQSDRKPKR
jgi:preprotein translocase subunit SecA